MLILVRNIIIYFIAICVVISICSNFVASSNLQIIEPYKIVALEKALKEAALPETETNFKATNENIGKLLRLDPLNDNALVYYNRIQFAQSQVEPNNDVYLVVKSRNPRNRKNLAHLLNHSLNVGDLKTAVECMDILYRLEIDLQDSMLTLLNAVYNSDIGRASINHYLSNNPSWGLQFLTQKVQDSSEIDFINLTESIGVYTSSVSNTTRVFYLINEFSQKLFEADKLELSIHFWNSIAEVLGYELIAQSTLNFNPEMHDIGLPGPFNWYYFHSKYTIIDNTDSDLYISFLGKTKTNIGQQFFIPQKGPFKLSVQAEYEYLDQEGNFFIQIQCMKPEKHHVTINMTNDMDLLENIFPGFEDNCELAKIILGAKPGPLKQRISVLVSAITLETVGGIE